MLKKLAQAGACVLLLGASMVNVAEAGVVLGASVGKSQFDYTDIDDGSARNFYIGYEVNESPLFFELVSIDSGDADVISLQDVTLNVSGTQVGLGYRGILNPETGSGFFFKGGMYSTDTEAAGPGGTATESGSGLYLGFGGDLMFVPNFGLRFDLEGLLGVSDFADDNNVTLIMVGPVFRFGGGEQQKPQQ